MGVFKQAWEMKKKMEKGMQMVGEKDVRPLAQAIGHMPAAMFSTPGLPPKKKKQ